MNDTRELLRRLDRAEAPDVWAEASSRIVERSPDLDARRRRGSRIASVALAMTISVVAIGAVVIAFERGSEPVSVSPTALPERILFTSTIFPGHPGQVYSMGPDGSDVRQLAGGSNNYSSISLSPDGNRIAYVRLDLELGDNGSISRVGREAIYVADADGSNARAIYESRQSPQSLTGVDWSPDGASIGFILTSRPPGGGSEADWRYQLMVMGTDGSDPHPISDEKITSFSWSPDGNRIAYTLESVDGTRLIDDIYTMSVDGSDRRRLTSDGISRSPIWSPDGSLIAFQQRSEVAVMRADGSSVRQLSAGGGFDALGALDWSPDSSRVLVDGVHSGGDCTLMAIGLDGAVSTLLRGPIPLGPGSGDSGSPSAIPCVNSAAWSVASEGMSPSTDAEPLLGAALADSLGLKLLAHLPSSGCHYYVEVNDPAGYCLDGIASGYEGSDPRRSK